MRHVWAFVVAGLVSLAAIWAFNRFSGKNVSDLGKA